MGAVRATCCYCGVGCGVVIDSEGGRISGVRGDPDHPANFGRLCTKGSTLHLAAAQQGSRALFPEYRRRRSGLRQRAGWDETLAYAADRFAAVIRAHGPDAVAFYVSGQMLTEDYYVFNKLAKGLIGTNNIDSNSRLCMSSAVAGYKATLGADAPPACYEDVDHAGCILIAGSNTACAHPVLFRGIEDARRRNPRLKMIVADPRRTDTAQGADLHLAVRPGSDVALFHAMLHVMLREGLCDLDYIGAHTEGFAGLKDRLGDYGPAAAAQICGVKAEDIVQAARWFAAGPTLSLYCQGLNQSCHGSDKNAALINLHLASGQIGKPGAGPFSLTGQPNAMGGREVGGMSNLLSAHRDLSDPAHRAEVARLWGVPAVPERPGKSALEMFDAVHRGEIKALWIVCTNPAHSLPNQAHVRQALERAELVVLQEADRFTDTAPYADVLLPAAAWGEKEGTVTNSERRISRVRRAVPPPGEARPDWQIAADFALRLGQALGKPLAPSLFPYRSAQQVFDEHRETTRGRDLDITGLSYAVLERDGPQQWPFPEGAAAGRARLYGDGVFPTASGRARFAAAVYAPPAEAVDARYPLHLNTGRLRDQWHGMSRTGTVAQLYNHAQEPLLAMHREDMARRGIADGDVVRMLSRRGELVLPAAAGPELGAGQVFLPMHWGGRFMNGAGSNALTLGVVDPLSGQPELKHAAVAVERLSYPWRMVVLRRGDGVALLQRAQPLLQRFGYASCGLYGRERPVLVLRAANVRPAPAEWIAELDRALELDDDACAMTYRDPRRGIDKRVLVQDGQLLGARLIGETAACDWLKDTMAAGLDAAEVRQWVLAPLAAPPPGGVGRGRVVCNCMDVAELDIRQALAAGADLEALQDQLRCGTRCGSCVPELRRMVAGAAPAGALAAGCRG